MFEDILSPHARKVAYAIFAVLGIVLGATQVGFLAAESGQPVWLTVALAVYGFVGGATGLTAQANTHERRTARILPVNPPEEPQV